LTYSCDEMNGSGNIVDISESRGQCPNDGVSVHTDRIDEREHKLGTTGVLVLFSRRSGAALTSLRHCAERLLAKVEQDKVIPTRRSCS
jgi:hypothetical protein